MPTVTQAEARKPFVLTLDVGSSSLRIGLFDARGRTIVGTETKTEYAAQTDSAGGVYFDAATLLETVTDGITHALDTCASLTRDIRAVAIDTFWHSLIGVDNAGNALTPILTWADTRSHADALALHKEIIPEAIHRRTGSLIHATYWPTKLRWLARTDSTTFGRVARWLSFGEYLYLHLFGQPRISFSMASGTGLFDQAACVWDAEMLRVCDVRADQLSPLDTADEPLTGLKEPYASKWPALTNIGWYPAYGDGATSNIGSGCFTPERIAVNIGTSGAMRIAWQRDDLTDVPMSLWCYRIDRQRLLIGGALSNGGNVYAWLHKTLAYTMHDGEEAALAQMQPDAHGLTVLPFLAGERAPGYAANARATFSGINLETTPRDIMRASLEAVMYRFYAVYTELCKVAPDAQDVVVSGKALLSSAMWQHVLGDVLNQPIQPSCETEATSRGAALLVLERLGVLELKNAEFDYEQTYRPNADNHTIYQNAIARQNHLYDLLIG